MDWAFWLPVLAGGAVSGASSGLLGVYIVGMRIPFLAVCVAHAALAGAVFASLAGWSGDSMLLAALIAAVATGLALGWLEEHTLRIDPNVLIGVLFSFSMGLAFLGIGLHGVIGRPEGDVRALLWGNVALCQWSDVGVMLGVGAALALYIVLFRKELRAILFSRLHASAAGVAVGPIWTGFLVLASAALTVSFQVVGGLMIYSLITNPALAAIQLSRGHERTLALSATLGVVCSVAGFGIAAATDLPTGATIVLTSSVLVGVAALIRVLRRHA